MEIIIAFAAGLILTSMIAWLISRSIIKSRTSQAEQTARVQAETIFKVEQTRLETELVHANARAEEMIAKLKEQEDEAEQRVVLVKNEASAALKQSKEEAEALLQRTKAEDAQLLENTKAELRKRNQEDLDASDKAHREAMDSLQKRFDETIAKVTAEVQAKTNEMLKASQKEFSESSNASIGQLVNPLKDNIVELRKAMEEGSKEQAERNGEMRQHIKNLMEQSDAARKSADELAAAFKHSGKVQGDWGEAVLDELLSSQGLTNGVHYHTQAAITSDLRPDVVMHLDSKREVIIDSKVSLTAYMKYVNAENEEDKRSFLKEHIESVKKHWKELSKKDYSSYIKAPKVSTGFVIMFVPVAGAFWSALNEDPGLWREAANNNVYITDEMSLYSVLKMIKLTWTQIAQAQNHEKVYGLAEEMVKRVGMFMKHFDAIGDALKSATDSFNEGREKLTPGGQSILTTTQKLIELGVKNEGKYQIKELQDVAEIPVLPSETITPKE